MLKVDLLKTVEHCCIFDVFRGLDPKWSNIVDKISICARFIAKMNMLMKKLDLGGGSGERLFVVSDVRTEKFVSDVRDCLLLVRASVSLSHRKLIGFEEISTSPWS